MHVKLTLTLLIVVIVGGMIGFFGIMAGIRPAFVGILAPIVGIGIFVWRHNKKSE